MAITYDISTASGRIRRLIGDTVDGSGPLPDGSNFSDNEITAFYEDEGSHIQRAAAAALEALANAWAAFEGRLREGPTDEESLSSAAFAARAERLRQVYGYNTASDNAAAAMAGGFSVGMRRSDA